MFDNLGARWAAANSSMSAASAALIHGEFDLLSSNNLDMIMLVGGIVWGDNWLVLAVESLDTYYIHNQYKPKTLIGIISLFKFTRILW